MRTVHVPGLNERSPTQRLGDHIFVRRQANPNVWFDLTITGFAHGNIIEFKIPDDFKYVPNELCDVRFTVNRIPFQRMHRELEVEAADRILFPNQTHAEGIERLNLADILAIWPYDSRVDFEQNPQQIEAVADILRRPPGSPPFLIYGGYVYLRLGVSFYLPRFRFSGLELARRSRSSSQSDKSPPPIRKLAFSFAHHPMRPRTLLPRDYSLTVNLCSG
jgi:hypothetical protein